MLARPARARPARVPPPQRAARRRRDRHRPGARRRAPASPSASRRCGRTGRRARARPRPRSTPASPVRRRGVGIGCMWYGIGNTAHVQPVDHARRRWRRDGTLTLYNGAVDIGQGCTTIMVADLPPTRWALPVARSDLVLGDTDLTLDAGKTSASRQTFVSGNAARLAGEALRRADPAPRQCRRRARLALDGPALAVSDGDVRRSVDLRQLAPTRDGDVLRGRRRRFDPPTTAARRGRPGRALRDLWLRRADRRRSRSTSSSAP